jgi:hypothetical protein
MTSLALPTPGRTVLKYIATRALSITRVRYVASNFSKRKLAIQYTLPERKNSYITAAAADKFALNILVFRIISLQKQTMRLTVQTNFYNTSCHNG